MRPYDRRPLPALYNNVGLTGHACVVPETFESIPLGSNENFICIPPQLSCVVPKRRNEFLAGRLCAAQALYALTGTYVRVGMGFNREPLWPNRVIGSITHAAGIACAVVADANNYLAVGIDIEAYVNRENATQLLPQIATVDEFALVAEHVGHTHAFTLLFSAKEALYKATFPQAQRFIDFHEARCLQCSDCKMTFVFTSQDLLRFNKGCSVTYELGEEDVRTLCLLPLQR